MPGHRSISGVSRFKNTPSAHSADFTSSPPPPIPIKVNQSESNQKNMFFVRNIARNGWFAEPCATAFAIEEGWVPMIQALHYSLSSIAPRGRATEELFSIHHPARLFVTNQWKCLSMNHLHAKLSFFRSTPVKAGQGTFFSLTMHRHPHETSTALPLFRRFSGLQVAGKGAYLPPGVRIL